MGERIRTPDPLVPNRSVGKSKALRVSHLQAPAAQKSCLSWSTKCEVPSCAPFPMSMVKSSPRGPLAANFKHIEATLTRRHGCPEPALRRSGPPRVGAPK